MITSFRRADIASQVAFAVMIGLALLLAYGWTLWKAPELLISQDLRNDPSVTPTNRLLAEHNARLIVISLGGALVVIVGLLYTARNYRLAHRGQVTERFTKALERLGSDELYVRIGGINALTHVMRDSFEHYEDVVEVLVAFVRDQAPRTTKETVGEDRWMHPPIGSYTAEPHKEPSADVEAALKALGTRPNHSKDAVIWLHFNGLHIGRANLANAQFEGAYMQCVQLEHAYMPRIYLQDARLEKAQLKDSFMASAQLQRALLRSANLERADLRYANLEGANLENANLVDANLKKTNLLGANLRGAQLDGADLRGAIVDDLQLQLAKIDETTKLPEEQITETTRQWKGITLPNLAFFRR